MDSNNKQKIERYVTIGAVGDDYYPDPIDGINHAQDCGFLVGEGSGSQIILAEEVVEWAKKNGKKVYFRVYLTNFAPHEDGEVGVDTYYMYFPDGGAEECFAHRLVEGGVTTPDTFHNYHAPTFCEIGRATEDMYYLWSD